MDSPGRQPRVHGRNKKKAPEGRQTRARYPPSIPMNLLPMSRNV
jgi:hypothetical protein